MNNLSEAIRNMQKPLFVVFEGLDGAGTTTQLNILSDWLKNINIPCETTKEPTNGPIGAIIRQVIDKRTEMDATALALAFASDRLDHLKNPANGIEHSLDEGAWVLCDRYLFSSLAYQTAAGIDTDWLIDINKHARTPDVTIFIDTDPGVCVDRINRRSTHDELYHDENHLRQTLRVYRRIVASQKLTGKLIAIDGNQKPDTVFDQIRSSLMEWVSTTPQNR